MTKRMTALFVAASLAAAILSGCGFSSGSALSSASAVSSSAAASSAPVPTPKAASAAQPAATDPLTGKTRSASLPADQRPVAVFVDNAAAALPQLGIGSADVLVEMLTENGSTGLTALYSDLSALPQQIGPAGCAYDGPIRLLMPVNPVFVNIGSSAAAGRLLNYYADQNVDGLDVGTAAFALDAGRYAGTSQEHCWFTNADLIRAGMAAAGVQANGTVNSLFRFAAPDAAVTLPDTGKEISFSFSDAVTALIRYDEPSGLYTKSMNGAAQIDALTGAQVSYKNVLILFASTGSWEGTGCAKYDLSEGIGYYFTGGTSERITFRKSGPQAELSLFAADHTLLHPAAGTSYIAVVPYSRYGDLKIDAPAGPLPDSSSGTTGEPSASAAAPASSAPQPG